MKNPGRRLAKFGASVDINNKPACPRPEPQLQPSKDVKSSATTKSALSEVPLQVDYKKRQAPKSLANPAALPVHRMPAPFYRRTRQESNLSPQTHPRCHLQLQSRLLHHRHSIHPASALPRGCSRPYHQLLVDHLQECLYVRAATGGRQKAV